ncbi:MAG: integrase family protein [Candidatus Dechloromonas phosphoritropha]
MEKQRRSTERVKLTVERIRKLAQPEGQQAVYVFDTEQKQLCVRITPAGAKSFVYAGKLKGSPLRATIGSTEVWLLDDAREEARRLQTLIDKGIDPRELEREKAEAKARAKAASEAAKQDAENRKRYTLRALCEAYSDLLDAKGKGQSATQTRSIFKCHVFETQPTIAALPAADVTAHQIAAIVRKVSEQGKERTAGILRSYLSAAFNAARKAPFDAKLPAALIAYAVETNPVEPVSTIAVQRGDRTLNTAELKNYMAALGDDLTGKVLKLALLAGGQRMAQLLRAKVSDYDEQTQTLRLWDGKGKRTTPREHLLPLAPEAIAIVESLRQRADALKTPLLFSSTGSTQMVETTPGKCVSAISKAMKREAFDLRDIRRTCETMLAGMGINRDTRAQLLSHGLSGVQAAHYDRHTYTDEKRAALVAWEQRLAEIATGKQAANVVQMNRKKAT